MRFNIVTNPQSIESGAANIDAEHEGFTKDDAEAIFEAFNSHRQDKRKEGELRDVYAYKLGEEINNGVKYFGQEKSTKQGTTAMCICPICDELWRVPLYAVKHGRIKSCCNQGGRK